jgi:hypothetical protein
MSAHWEYTQTEVEGVINATSAMNHMARSGWELVSVTYGDLGRYMGYSFFWRRPPES